MKVIFILYLLFVLRQLLNCAQVEHSMLLSDSARRKRREERRERGEGGRGRERERKERKERKEERKKSKRQTLMNGVFNTGNRVILSAFYCETTFHNQSSGER